MLPISSMAHDVYTDDGNQSVNNVVGEKLNPSGSLLFFPQHSGVDIYDVHAGDLALHVALPDPIPLDTNAMALDETGTKMFLISSTGITIAQLYQAPLSLTVVPFTKPLPRTMIAAFGTAHVAATFVDSNTLQAVVPSLPAGPVALTVQNPNGQQYTLDDAFTAQ
jgi:hypothetical protein